MSARVGQRFVQSRSDLAWYQKCGSWAIDLETYNCSQALCLDIIDNSLYFFIVCQIGFILHQHCANIGPTLGRYVSLIRHVIREPFNIQHMG